MLGLVTPVKAIDVGRAPGAAGQTSDLLES